MNIWPYLKAFDQWRCDQFHSVDHYTLVDEPHRHNTSRQEKIFDQPVWIEGHFKQYKYQVLDNTKLILYCWRHLAMYPEITVLKNRKRNRKFKCNPLLVSTEVWSVLPGYWFPFWIRGRQEQCTWWSWSLKQAKTSKFWLRAAFIDCLFSRFECCSQNLKNLSIQTSYNQDYLAKVASIWSRQKAR